MAPPLRDRHVFVKEGNKICIPKKSDLDNYIHEFHLKLLYVNKVMSVNVMLCFSIK